MSTIALLLALLAAEPAPRPTGLEGLGFSVIPKGGGKTETAIFGLKGEGYKFVYLVDRSGSMSLPAGRSTLDAVKKELLASLGPLDSVHQFQLIFYNEKPALYNPTGVAGRLVFATPQNKALVEDFLQRLQPDGGTYHEEALRLATSLHPDVIFWLSDAGKPPLEAAELARVERWAAGIRINAIEFGETDSAPADSFMATVARRTGGQYKYVPRP